jgi:creatinine amidohydrolase
MAEFFQSWLPRLSMRKFTLAILAALLIAILAARPRKTSLPETIEMSEMTWVEIRSAVAHGYTTAIVPSGGIEENGPHMILGKHDQIVRWTSHQIAKTLGNALVTPIVSFVPEGDYDPPTGLMRFPGTIGVSEQAFAAVLEGIARSLKASGFKNICLIADHGGSLGPQAQVAARLSREWASQGVHVFDITAYYGSGDVQNEFLKAQGETSSSIGEHAGIADTSELMAVNPKGVDLSRAGRGVASEWSGVVGDPTKATAERGRALLNMKVQAATKQIRALIPQSDRVDSKNGGVEPAP